MKAPTEPGVYPYICTFPGHRVVMNGVMVVAADAASAEAMLAASQPKTSTSGNKGSTRKRSWPELSR